MKKVLLAFDGEQFSPDLVAFVNQIHLYQPLHAVGLFLPTVEYAELLYSFSVVPSGPLLVSEVVLANDAIVQQNMTRFREMCAEAGIECTARRQPARNIADLLHEETRFADLLVLSSNSFYDNAGADTREDYIENVLHGAECPVILLPETYREPKNIILTYDGGGQSAFAIKQFSYLFPRSGDLNALLVYFSENDSDMPLRHEVQELLACHFRRFTVTKVDIRNEEDIEKWMLAHSDPMLVAGAYGRRTFSDLFKKGFISDIVRHHKMPIFVAHK